MSAERHRSRTAEAVRWRLFLHWEATRWLTPALGPASPAVVTRVAKDWLAWYDAVSGQELRHRDTWIPERMEYGCSIAAPGPNAETVLSAAAAPA